MLNLISKSSKICDALSFMSFPGLPERRNQYVVSQRVFDKNLKIEWLFLVNSTICPFVESLTLGRLNPMLSQAILI